MVTDDQISHAARRPSDANGLQRVVGRGQVGQTAHLCGVARNQDIELLNSFFQGGGAEIPVIGQVRGHSANDQGAAFCTTTNFFQLDVRSNRVDRCICVA